MSNLIPHYTISSQRDIEGNQTLLYTHVQHNMYSNEDRNKIMFINNK